MHIGLDLGGTKLEIAALDPQGREHYRQRRRVKDLSYEETVAAVVELVQETEAAIAARASLGIGTPGALSRRTGLMKNTYATPLNGRPFKADLEAALGREVRLANDANCFTLSEAVDGAGAGAEVVFGVILGTGVGGGIVVNGGVLHGINGAAGEWGHNALPWPDAEEPPGYAYYARGARDIEAYLCGAGLALDYERATGERCATQEIAAGDSPAKDAALARYERRLAKALASAVNLLDPDVIVLGGGLSNIDRLYENVPALWGEWVFSDTVETALLRNRHGDSSGVRGAAWLWKETRV